MPMQVASVSGTSTSYGGSALYVDAINPDGSFQTFPSEHALAGQSMTAQNQALYVYNQQYQGFSDEIIRLRSDSTYQLYQAESESLQSEIFSPLRIGINDRPSRRCLLSLLSTASKNVGSKSIASINLFSLTPLFLSAKELGSYIIIGTLTICS